LPKAKKSGSPRPPALPREAVKAACPDPVKEFIDDREYPGVSAQTAKLDHPLAIFAVRSEKANRAKKARELKALDYGAGWTISNDRLYDHLSKRPVKKAK
jgi:hypothetical protein